MRGRGKNVDDGDVNPRNCRIVYSFARADLRRTSRLDRKRPGKLFVIPDERVIIAGLSMRGYRE